MSWYWDLGSQSKTNSCSQPQPFSFISLFVLFPRALPTITSVKVLIQQAISSMADGENTKAAIRVNNLERALGNTIPSPLKEPYSAPPLPPKPSKPPKPDPCCNNKCVFKCTKQRVIIFVTIGLLCVIGLIAGLVYESTRAVYRNVPQNGFCTRTRGEIVQRTQKCVG